MIFKIQPFKGPVNLQQYDLCTTFKSTPRGHVHGPKFWIFLDFIKEISKFKVRKNSCWSHRWAIYQRFCQKNFFPKFQNFHVKNGSNVKSNKNSKQDASNFDEVQKISKFGPMDMPSGSTFELGTQIILVKLYILRRPQIFVKPPPYFCPMLCQSKVRCIFCKFLWPSQNI